MVRMFNPFCDTLKLNWIDKAELTCIGSYYFVSDSALF